MNTTFCYCPHCHSPFLSDALGHARERYTCMDCHSPVGTTPEVLKATSVPEGTAYTWLEKTIRLPDPAVTPRCPVCHNFVILLSSMGNHPVFLCDFCTEEIFFDPKRAVMPYMEELV